MKLILLLSFVPPILLLMYPVISYIRYRFFAIPIAKSEQFIAPISIIIACYNEEKYIRTKIMSFLEESEWIKDSEIIVVSGGSTDNTNKILCEFKQHPSIVILSSPVKLSKIEAVNLAVESTQHDLLVFSDCRQRMKKGSVKQLIHNFNDATVGTIVAMLSDPDENKKQSIFRVAINKTAYFDSQSSSALNVYGALYAQRKSIFQKFPNDQLFDDLCVIVTTLTQKMRLIQEPKAIIYDVNFQAYYGGERLERLIRGLLLFLTKYWSQISKLNTKDLLRLLIFKYVKLLLPFCMLIWIIYLVYWLNTTNNFRVSFVILCALGIILLIQKTRTLFILIVRINVHFFIATIKFFLLNNKSTNWEKLKTVNSIETIEK